MKQWVLDSLGCSVSQLCRSCSGALSDHGPRLPGCLPPFLLDSVSRCSATQVPSLAISHSSLLSSHIQSTADSDIVASAPKPLPPHSYKPPLLPPRPDPPYLLPIGLSLFPTRAPCQQALLLQSVLCSQSEFPNGHVWSRLSPTQKLKAEPLAWHCRPSHCLHVPTQPSFSQLLFYSFCSSGNEPLSSFYTCPRSPYHQLSALAVSTTCNISLLPSTTQIMQTQLQCYWASPRSHFHLQEE